MAFAGGASLARIFLSHSSANDAEAVALRDWLVAEGWDDLFLDLDPTRGIAAGERWELALNEAANRCEAVLFLVGRDWLASKWCLKELSLAAKLNKRMFGIFIEDIPVDELPPDLTATHQLVNLAAGSDHRMLAGRARDGSEVRVTFSQSALAKLKTGLMRAGLDARFFPWPPEDEPDRSPYRGLEPMEAEDAGIFFGREAPTIAALDRLRGLAEGAAPRLMAILGASGAGKSSFLRAGLVPRLARDDRAFLMLPIVRPERRALTGEDGFVRCLETAAKAHGLGKSRADIRAAVDAGPSAVAALLDELASKAAVPDLDSDGSGRPPRVVLAVDQGEELFLSEGSEEAAAFLALIRDLAGAERSSLIVLFTIRSDLFEQLQTAPALDGLSLQTFNLPPMPRGAYQTVIEGPAKRLTDSERVLTVEPALTEALLADIEEGGGKDALPLLAFTLQRLYEEYGTGGKATLTLAQYRALGGIRGSIEAAVKDALKAADADAAVPKDEAARLALLRHALVPWLAGIDLETSSPRRRVARLSEIPEEARPLVEHLIAARLLSTDVSPETGERTVEPAHEALLRQWGLLQGWLEEDFAALSALEGVKRAARDWAANAEDGAWLAHTAGRLEDAEAVARRDDFAGTLEPTDRAYLAAARTADDVRRNHELDEARQLAEAQRKVAHRTRFGLIAASVLAVAAISAAVFGFQKAQEARNQTAIAEAKTVVAIHNETVGLAALSMVALDQGRPADAVKLALAAWPRTGRTDRPPLKMTLEALGTALPHLRQRHVLKPGGTLKTAVFSPDGSRVLTISSDGSATFWDAETGAELTSFKADDSAIESAAFSPDGSRVVIASANGVVRIWDVAKGSVVAVLKGHEKKVNDAIFSPDGKLVATASDDKTARIWDATTGAQLHVLEPKNTGLSVGDVQLVVFSPDGTRIATKLGDGPTTMWDTTTGTELFTVAPDAFNNLDSVAFAPDGKLFVSASKSQAGIWDATTGALVAILRGHKDWLTSVAFSPDGLHVLTAAGDRTARIWDVSDGHQTAVLEGHTDFVLSATYSRSGDRILTASADGTARIWDAATGKTVAALQGHEGWVSSASFSPDATRIVTASADGTARLWDAAAGPPAVILHHDKAVNSAAFSPDGTRLVTGSEDGTARIWNVATGAEGTALKGPVQISLVLFSPDGKRVLTLGINTQIWDSASGVQLATLGSEDAFQDTAAFSPDGTRVVTGTYDDGKVSIWNAETGVLVVPLEGPETTVRDVAFSPDGKRVVTAADDGAARVWDAATGAQLAEMKHEKGVVSAAFSPDGSLVATASLGAAAIWDAHMGARKFVLHHDGWVRWVAFSPDGKRVVTGSDDRTARIWNTATGKAMAVLTGHTASVRSAVFSLDGTRVLTASDDGTARIWDAETGAELAVLKGHGDKVSSAVFSPDGTKVATASLDGTARIWDVSHVEQGNAFAIACRRLGNDTELGAAQARFELGNLVPICGDHFSLPVDGRQLQ